MNMPTIQDLMIQDYCKRLIDSGKYEVTRRKKSLLFKDYRLDEQGKRSHQITVGFPGEIGQLEMKLHISRGELTELKLMLQEAGF